MHKPAIHTILITITLLCVPLHAEDTQNSPKRWQGRVKAYAKISYGITSVLMGIGAIPMGVAHLWLGHAASQSSEAVDGANNLLERFAPRLAKGTENLRGMGEGIMRARATIQKTSGGFYLISPFFFIPLGLAAIKSGRRELQQLNDDCR